MNVLIIAISWKVAVLLNFQFRFCKRYTHETIVNRFMLHSSNYMPYLIKMCEIQVQNCRHIGRFYIELSTYTYQYIDNYAHYLTILSEKHFSIYALENCILILNLF